MNETVNKFLFIIVNKFITYQINLCQKYTFKTAWFSFSACGSFTKSKEGIEKSMQTENTDFIYRNELDKTSFQHDMAYGKSKDLTKTFNQNI